MESVLKCPGLVYDVGMHKGEDTAYYLKKGFTVAGFEADPLLADHCEARFAAAIREKRLVIIRGAVSALVPPGGKIKFYRNLDDSVWGTAVERWAERNRLLGTRSEIIEVDAVDFSECLRRYGMPHYMKIDIEGSDAVCLRALRAFRERPDYLSFESEKEDFEKLKEEFTLLEELGYHRFKAVQQENTAAFTVSGPKNSSFHHEFCRVSSGPFGEDLPGRWKTRNETLALYRMIFLSYRLFGDFGILKRSRRGAEVLSFLKRFKTPLPGWYDTHAKYCPVPLSAGSRKTLLFPS